MMKSGKFTSQYVKSSEENDVEPDRVQPHGVELTVDKVFKVTGIPVIKDGDYHKGERTEATLNDGDTYVVKDFKDTPIMESADSMSSDMYNEDELVSMEDPHYVLHRGSYVVKYNEIIEVPDDHVGFVIPRSRVIRSGQNLSTAVWDSGYRGRGEGGLHINDTCFLEKGMGIAQFVLMRATVYEQYDGSHQGENVDSNDDS